MAAPVVTGSYAAHLGLSGTANIDISSVPIGGWMVVSVMVPVSSAIVTPPSGWSAVVQGDVTGTRTNFLFVKIKTTDDGSVATFSQNTTLASAYAAIWGTGSPDVDSWSYGSVWRRATGSQEPSGARYSNIMPSVTTTSDDALVLAVSHEATNAMTNSNEVVSVTPTSGWVQQVWLPQVNVGDRVQTIWVAAKQQAVAGATGDVTVTYENVQDNNGWAMQIVIPSGGFAASATPAVVGTPTSYAGATAVNGTVTVDIPRPLGMVNGDYVFVFFRHQTGTASGEPTIPSFTHYGPAFIPNNTTDRVNAFLGHLVTDVDSEPASYTASISIGAGNTRCVAVAFLVRGVHQTNPIAGYYDSYAGTNIAGGVRTDSYAVTDAPVLTLFAAAAEFSASLDHTPLTLPSGYSLVTKAVTSENLSASRTFAWVGAKETTASTTDAPAITWGTPSATAAQSISLRGIPTGEIDPAGAGYTVANGAGDPVKLYYTTSDGPRTPVQVVPVRAGFANVTEAIGTYGATWAHRGGSASYPEMSLYGYTQSVVRGYGALEVSLARTSDGVWFGLHDQTTDRTSGGTYGSASSQTWAQIQAQMIVSGPGSARPYMRWEEIVAAYGKTHVLIVDPKYALGAYRTEFLTMVKNDVGVDRAIIKYSGPGSGATGLASAAQAMGFQTWGFFYAGDASAAQGGNGNLQTWGPYWTTIGMEYGASQAIWDEALALGKPVIGHIASNQAAYDMAMMKGASAVQVSGVAVVRPVSWWT